jgi:bifunctional DNA-binding transcriptional regulator/antitoxin component of YhaV-PrlF toxin-antitoxin module
MSKIYTTKVVEICDNGDAIVELPDELVTQLGWEIGDTLDYKLKDGKVFIKNLTKDKKDGRTKSGKTKKVRTK